MIKFVKCLKKISLKKYVIYLKKIIFKLFFPIEIVKSGENRQFRIEIFVCGKNELRLCFE